MTDPLDQIAALGARADRNLIAADEHLLPLAASNPEAQTDEGRALVADLHRIVKQTRALGSTPA